MEALNIIEAGLVLESGTALAVGDFATLDCTTPQSEARQTEVISEPVWLVVIPTTYSCCEPE